MMYFILNKKTGRFAEVVPFNGSIQFLAAFQRNALRVPEAHVDEVLQALGVTREDVTLVQAREPGKL